MSVNWHYFKQIQRG
jgi:large subunit ribosomal protein L47